jgi:long-chain fatty acid transport protein
MKRISAFVAALIVIPAVAHAGGFEIYEQSPAGVGTAGAQAAVVDDSGAVFYNPARMTYIRGFSGLAGVNILNANTRARPPDGSPEKASNILTAAPTVYGVQRIGSRFAIGLGGFSNFGQVFEWPGTFPGRYLGYHLNLTTATINPSVAFRPLPWLSIGVGIDIVPSAIEISRTLNFGGADGNIHTSGTATGVGGNLGLYVRVVPRWLDFAFTYRSSVDLDFEGKAALTVPPELASQTSALQNMKASITLPHNFTFGVASHLAKHFSVEFDVHLTLWDVEKSLTLTLTDPAAPAGTPPTTVSQVLDWRISYDLRLGLEYRLLNEALRLRIGGGYVRTPEPRASLIPLATDADRGLFGFGIGYHWSWGGVDASYLAVILPDRTSAEPSFRATYDSIGHVIALGLSLHFADFPRPIDEPDYKN